MATMHRCKECEDRDRFPAPAKGGRPLGNIRFLGGGKGFEEYGPYEVACWPGLPDKVFLRVPADGVERHPCRHGNGSDWRVIKGLPEPTPYVWKR